MLDFASDFFAGHEQVVFCSDTATGLSAIIAIHSTRLGPAAGGCRFHPYRSTQEALDDVLRLSEAMTWKNALAGLKLGGGKSVIIGDPRAPGATGKLHAFARHVERLGGLYWTAEDVGVGLDSVAELGRFTRYVFGTRAVTGDPAPFTARGVVQGLRAAVREKLQRDTLDGVHVAVQGVGSVGWQVCSQLHAEGAVLTVADRNAAATERARDALGAAVVGVDDIHCIAADVFAPCALGGIVNARSVGELGAGIVAGAANNVLDRPADGIELSRRGILFAPDFLINAGGMLKAGREILGTCDDTEVAASIDRIFDTTLEIFARARTGGRTPEEEALALARERIAAAA